MATNMHTMSGRRHPGRALALASRRRARFVASDDSLLTRMIETLLVWQERGRQRAALMRLDDARLSDIGLSRAEAESEYRKPFWRP